MDSLTALDDCLARALRQAGPVAPEVVPLAEGCGHVLAEDLAVPGDIPPVTEALRAGFAVPSLDLTGATAHLPVPLGRPVRVRPGDPLPPGCDAVLPEDGAEADGAEADGAAANGAAAAASGRDGAATTGAPGIAATRSVRPGEGARRAGHDARAGAIIARAGTRLAARQRLVAEVAGADRCTVRRPRVQLALPDARVAAFAADWLRALGARLSEDAPHLVLRPAGDARPRLALAPGETAALGRAGAALVLSLPDRFDGAVAACLALGTAALAALGGAPPLREERPLARKASAAPGMSDLVLLTREGPAWRPAPAGSVTLAALAAADAYAILGPESEGLPAGAPLAGTPLDRPLG